MQQQKKIPSRERILHAAVGLAHEIGPAHISLDAVAARAGLSKGGLLYYFPTKAKLLEAVVEEYMKEHEKLLKIQEELQPDGANRIARAIATFTACSLTKNRAIAACSQRWLKTRIS